MITCKTLKSQTIFRKCWKKVKCFISEPPLSLFAFIEYFIYFNLLKFSPSSSSSSSSSSLSLSSSKGLVRVQTLRTTLPIGSTTLWTAEISGFGKE
jgi:hypothetical protein